MRAKAETMLQQADRLLCESWNERMWSDGEPVDPSPTIDQAVNGGFPWLEIRCARRAPREEALAKTELEEGLAALTARIPPLQLNGEPLEIRGHVSVRRVGAMRVHWSIAEVGLRARCGAPVKSIKNHAIE